MKTKWFFMAAMVLAVSVGSSYATMTYSTEVGVNLNQEYTDSLNGIAPSLSSNPIEGSAGSLTDATSATDPAGHTILPDNIINHGISWDVSSLGSNLELRSISIWVAGGDENRNHVNAQIFAVTNGQYTLLADLLLFDPAATAGYNHALWQWDAGDITNVTAVQVVMYWGPGGQHSRLVEIDGNLVSVPEPATMSLLAASGLALIRRKR